MSDVISEEQVKAAARILARRYRKPPKKHRSRIENLHPVLEFMFDEMSHLEIPDVEVTTKAGLGANVLSSWRSGRGPTLATLEPALNVLGYTLVAIPLPENR